MQALKLFTGNANRALALETMLLAMRRLARDPERVPAWTNIR